MQMKYSWRRMPATLAIAIASAAVATAGASANERYVALGDSYTAGTGIPQATTTFVPFGCWQSTVNYPRLVKQAMGFSSFADASCGAAESRHIRNDQEFPVNSEAQRKKLQKGRTSLVTLGFGGNDIELVGKMAECVALSGIWWESSPCKNRNGSYIEKSVSKLEDNIKTAIEAIRNETDTEDGSHKARIIAVGYQRIIRDNGCLWIPLRRGDATWANKITKEMNATIRETALANGAEFVDLYASSKGHDMCASRRDRWIESYLPFLNKNIAFGHPNAAGHKNAAKQVIRAIDSSGEETTSASIDEVIDRAIDRIMNQLGLGG